MPDGPETIAGQYSGDTRERILDATLAAMRDAGEEMVSIARVAELAGVADRTVYRHFKTRDALIAAAWDRMIELAGPNESPESADALIDEARRRFPQFDQLGNLWRAYLHSRMRGDIAGPRGAEGQQAILECIAEELPFMDKPTLRRRAAIAELLTSPYAWEFLQDAWGLDGDEAGACAAEALEILLNRRHPY